MESNIAQAKLEELTGKVPTTGEIEAAYQWFGRAVTERVTQEVVMLSPGQLARANGLATMNRSYVDAITSLSFEDKDSG